MLGSLHHEEEEPALYRKKTLMPFVTLYLLILPSNKSIASKSEYDNDIEGGLEACCSAGPTRTENPPPSGSLNVKETVTKVKTYIFSTRNRLFNSVAAALLLFFLALLGLVGPNSLVSSNTGM